MKRIVTAETTIEVSTDQMGEWFSDMADDEQMAFLNSCVEHMARWPLQWDAIARKLNEPENHNTRAILRALTETNHD